MLGIVGVGRRHSRHLSPAEERHRWLMTQSICLCLLALADAYFVYLALGVA
jgi:hypothetical protein